jgi:response regulator RpfG family c-di-GMP phosphodiesterase
LERAGLLKKAGLDVDASPFNPGGMITKLREDPPSLMLIDLDRLPSHGREVAMALRSSKSMRHLPIVFAGGVEEKVARVRSDVADAVFTDWAHAAAAVKKALKNPPVAFVKPVPHMQRFAGSPLAKKLDLKAGTKAALIGTEEGFVELLGDLPEVELQSRIAANTTLVLWFVRAAREIAAAFEIACARMPQGCSLWIIYPKKSGRYKVDFNQNDIRLIGLDAGVVDYKICAVDADWSGMKFARRKI